MAFIYGYRDNVRSSLGSSAMTDIRAYDGRTIRGIAGVVEVQGRLVTCRGEVIDESPPKEIPIELRSILVES